MKEVSQVNRNITDPYNALIYRYFKPEEIETLTDFEFAVLQKKLRPLIVEESGSLYEFQHGLNAEGISGNDAVLGIYRRSIATHHFYFDCLQRYSRIFSICYRLGAKNLYDIGCGQQMQGFLAVNVPEITYTGIDMDIFKDSLEEFECEPEFVNRYFEKFTGCERIKYIKDTYPCSLTIRENNAAILLGVFVPENHIPEFGTALARDFERAIISIPTQGKYQLEGISAKEIVAKDMEVWSRPFERLFNIWKESMVGFEFYKLGEGVVLGSKCPGDRAILEAEYLMKDDMLYMKVMDKPWYNLIEDSK